jgi:hypothetical protein
VLTQFVVLVQETAPSKSLYLAGLGLGITVKLVPFQLSMIVFPASKPTATQNVALEHETPKKTAFAIGPEVTIQLVPFQVSTRVCSRLVVTSEPTAMQLVGLAHETR